MHQHVDARPLVFSKFLRLQRAMSKRGLAQLKHIQKQFDALEAQKKVIIDADSSGNESSHDDKLVPDTPSPRTLKFP